MKARKSFIIVEDEAYICEQYRTRVKEHENLFLIDATDNAPDAVKLVSDYTPDAVILDIELNKSTGSGIDFLDMVAESCPAKKPFILAVTNLTTAYMHDQIHKRGGDFIITKDKPDYSIDYVLDIIDTLVSSSSLDKSRESRIAEITAQQDYTKRVRDRITTELNLLCMKPNLKGTAYLKDAIELNIYQRQDRTNDILAKRYSVTADSVEKAMNHAIHVTWKNDVDMLLSHYKAAIDPDRGTPTPTEFIYHYVDKIKDEV